MNLWFVIRSSYGHVRAQNAFAKPHSESGKLQYALTSQYGENPGSDKDHEKLRYGVFNHVALFPGAEGPMALGHSHQIAY